MFRSVLVANRGEIALRILKALSALGIRSVAVYSEADRDSPHLEFADEAVCIGGPRSSESYLDMEAILQTAVQTDCQAVHPGFGFLADCCRTGDDQRPHAFLDMACLGDPGCLTKI